MPACQQPVAIEKILPKVKTWLDKSPMPPNVRDALLNELRRNPHSVAKKLDTELERRLDEQLHPVRDRIMHPTPYLENLLNACSSSSDRAYQEKLEQLIVFEINDWKTPLNAWRAAILSAEVHMPLPNWAGTWFRKIFDSYSRGGIRDLAIAFGLKGASGKHAEFHKELRQRRDNQLSRLVRFYCLQGKRVHTSCILVANRIAEARRRDQFPETLYDLFPAFNPNTFAQTLAKKIYPRWLYRMHRHRVLSHVDAELRKVTEDVLFNHFLLCSTSSLVLSS